MAKTQGKARGRPSKYKPEFAEQVHRLCLLGVVDDEIAKFFDVSTSTLNDWKKVHPEFLESLKAGKAIADSKVAAALFHRAIGYSHPAVKIMAVSGFVQKVDYIEHYAPDPTSMIFWLKNRRPDLWREKPEPQDADEVPPPVKVIVQVQDASVPDADPQQAAV